MNPTERNEPLFELHAHLYGCLSLDDLSWLASRNKPRWDFFINSYERVYGKKPEVRDLFLDTPESRGRLEEYYYFRGGGSFARFQVCFDLIIALSTLEPEEIHEIARRVVGAQRETHAEYRQMFAPGTPLPLFREKVQAFAEGLARAERENPGKSAKAAISLDRRSERVWAEYEAVREVMSKSETAARMITGLDFCYIEEGHAPLEKKEFLERVLKDNRRDPARALGVLYHVGESFTDKSVESAARWVLEAGRLGAHRLGHCLALGVPPEFFAGTTREEVAVERIAQIDFLFREEESLRDAGLPVDRDALSGERRELAARDPAEVVPVHYDDARARFLGAFQDWAMERLKETGSILESCPTSNLRIGGLPGPELHPLRRFLRADLPVVLGADDPGIFDVRLQDEFALVETWEGIDAEDPRAMAERARRSTSERLSGRLSPEPLERNV